MNNLKAITNTAVMTGAIAASLYCSAGFANAQCVPGLSSTLTELSTQTFPTRLAADYSSLPFPVPGAPPQTFGTLTSVATDGNRIQVLDALSHSVWEIGVPPSGPVIVGKFYAPGVSSFAPGMHLIDAGGTVWATVPGAQYVMALGRMIYLSNGQVSNDGSYYSGILQINRTATGGIFDGKTIWFTTTTGQLLGVAPPIRGTTGSWTPPSVLSSIAVSNTALSNPVFDGRYIWVSTVGNSGPALAQVDSGSHTVVATHPMPQAITSLIYDGTFLWVGAEALALRYDPLTNTMTQWNVYGNTVLFNGMSTDVFGSGEHVSYRACDFTKAYKDPLPGAPSGAVMANGQYWVVYGTGILSLR